MSEAESTVDSYLSSLSSMPTRAIITGNSDGDIEHLETQLLRPRGREADVLDINDFTESSETDHDSDGSETSGTQRVNPKALDKGHHKLPANDRIPHQTRDIMSSLRQVNNELTSVLARLPLTETNSVPPPIRMAWTERNYGNQTRLDSISSRFGIPCQLDLLGICRQLLLTLMTSTNDGKDTLVGSYYLIGPL